jgi:YesN/AraC family two-component response regulator
VYRVLLIEDERWVRVALRNVLEQTGLPFQVVQECTHGLEALDWLKLHEADLIMADVKMPVMDGITFIEQLSQRSVRPSVILISGHDDFTFVQQALRYGVKDYLLKPVEKQDMTLCLQRWMDQYEQAPEHTPPPIESDYAKLSTVEHVIQIINESLPREVTLTDVAAKVHLNPSYLSHLFKQQTGQKFVDYIVMRRMDEAKKLVRATSLRISEIAERLGYQDIAYFSNTFKKMTGKTPLEYRKTEGKGNITLSGSIE